MPDFIQYPGGKAMIADWIIDHFPEHHCYVEVFGGGGSVLLAKDRSDVEVYNDKWDLIVDFFKAVRNHHDEVQEALASLPFSRSVHDGFRQEWKETKFEDDAIIDRAVKFYYLNRTSFNGTLRNVFKGAQSRSDARLYRKKIKQLSWLRDRFVDVIIENMDFEALMKRYDDEETLFYIDPPYLAVDRADEYYEPMFLFKDQERLRDTIYECNGKVLLSYYPKEGALRYLEAWYPRDSYHWDTKDVRKMAVKVKQREGDKRPEATELLISNYDPMDDVWSGRNESLDTFV